MSNEKDPFGSILGELAAPASVGDGAPKKPLSPTQMPPEEREARSRAALAVLLGKEMGIDRALNDDELNAAMQAMVLQKKRQASPVIGATPRMIIDDEGVGLGQIDNLIQPGRYIDEVEKFLIDKDKAARAAGGDDFYTRVEMQQLKHEQANTEAPFSRNNPRSITSAVLGNNISIVTQVVPTSAQGSSVLPPTPLNITAPQQVASWTGEDDETTNVICTFGAVLPPNAPAISSGVLSAPIRTFGLVQWGTRGNLLSAEVDIGPGCQFCVGAAQVLLSVGTDKAATIASSFPTVNLSGMISFGRTTRTALLTRTRYISVLQNGALAVSVPAFAKTLNILRNPYAAGYSVVFFDNVGNDIFDDTVAASTVQLTPYVVPPDAVSVQITAGATQINEMRLVFGLGL